MQTRLIFKFSQIFSKFTMRPSRLQMDLKSLDNWQERILICLLSLLVATILPIILFQFCILWCYRKTVLLLARIFKSQTFSKPLTIQSGMMANVDTMFTSPKFSIMVPVLLEGIPDIQKIREVIKTNLLEKIDPKTGNLFYPELLQSVGYWMGYPFWKKLDPFKINKISFLQECVHFYKDDETAEYDIHQLEIITKELCFKSFSKDRPMIEFVILPNFTPHPEKQAHLLPPSENTKYFAFILRIHHTLGDFYTILRLFQNLGISSASALDFLKPSDYTPGRGLQGAGFFNSMVKHVSFFYKMLYEVTEYLYKTALHCSEGCLWDWGSGGPASPKFWSSFPPSQLAQKHAEGFKTGWGKSFTLEEINEIKTIHGVSGTSVMYAAILGSIRKTMFTEGSNIPPYISFGMTLPLPRKNEKLRNFSALMTLFVPLGEGDPIKRLHKVQQRIDLMKKSTLPVAGTFLTCGALGLTPRVISSFIHETTKVQEFTVVSNIAGPRNTSFNLAGYTVKDIFWATGAAIDRNCLFVSIISAGGMARLVVTGTSKLLKSDGNAQRFINNFFEELQILKHNTPDSVCHSGRIKIF